MEHSLHRSLSTSPEGNLWAAVVRQAKKDLVSRDGRLALTAAEYFFLEDHNRFNIRTFAGVCAVVGIINADSAAKKIFRGLKPCQQRRVCGLLRDAGYNIRPELVGH